MAKTKWGILSAGKISHDFIAGIQMLPEDHQIVAIGARKLEDAVTLAEQFNVTKAYGSYEELAKDADVEIAYIGTISPYHCETTKLMLNHGKHVLCEKPMAMNYTQVKEMVDLAREKGLFLMEGIWSRFFPAYDFMRQSVESGPMKSATFMDASIGIDFFGGANYGANPDRIMLNSSGGGSLLNVGVYLIQLAMLLFKDEPERIVASGIIEKNYNVDKFISVTLYYSGDRAAHIKAHFGAAMNYSAYISCKNDPRSVTEVPIFITPSKIITPEKTHEFPLPESQIKFNSAALTYEIKGVRESLLKGEKESPYFTLSDSLALAKITDEIKKQIGLVYEADKAQHNL